jgi:hypothetical protein
MTGKGCAFSPPMRNSLFLMHVLRLRQEARKKQGEVWAMKKQLRFRSVKSTSVVLAYLWYNASLHAIVAKLLL